MSHPDIDDRMLLFDCLPTTQTPLEDGHPLQSAVPNLTSRGLRGIDRARALESARGLKDLQLSASTSRCSHLRRQQLHAHRTTPEKPAKSLSCPFSKLDHQRYRSCLAIEFRSVRSVKQHIIVDHHAPISCPICHDVFGSATDRDRHIVARNCVERDMARDPLAGVNEDQVEKLMLRDDVRRSPQRRGRQGGQAREDLEEQRWFRVWDVVFPGEPRPSSAYLTSPKEREAVAMRMYWRRKGPKMIHAALREEDRQDKEALAALQASVLKSMMERVGL